MDKLAGDDKGTFLLAPGVPFKPRFNGRPPQQMTFLDTILIIIDHK